MSKKILIFSLAYYPHIGGAEIAIKEITDRLDDIEFHLITLRFNKEDVPEEKIGNVLVHRIGTNRSYLSKVFFVLQAAAKARTLNKKNNFDGMWAMMTYMLFPVVWARLRGLNIPYVLTLQDGDPFEHVFKRPFIRVFIPLLRSGFRHASVVSAISTHLASWAKRMGYTRTVEIIPNGADIAHFSGELISHEGIVLITTSRLVSKNAIDDVIKALSLLPKNIRFKILGMGPEEQKLKALAKSKNVKDRVEFLGHIDHVAMPKFLHEADIFIRPSRSEGQGSSFIEAMAAGLPVIATQEGGIADFLFDKQHNPTKPPTGFAVPKNNPQAIAEMVETILHNKEETQLVVHNAKVLVQQIYNWDSIAKMMRERVFDQL